jgi:hypothetical protein
MTKSNSLNDNLYPCQCQTFTNAVTGENTGCEADTGRVFAPGHDAKLKGLLIRAGVAGQPVLVFGQKGEYTAEKAAAEFGFAAKVLESIAKGRKAAGQTEAAKGAAEAVPAPKKGRGTTFSATYGDITETRTSKTKTYTHAAVYTFSDGLTVIGSWHSSAALAAKGANGMKPIAVVPAIAQ